MSGGETEQVRSHHIMRESHMSCLQFGFCPAGSSETLRSLIWRVLRHKQYLGNINLTQDLLEIGRPVENHCSSSCGR